MNDWYQPLLVIGLIGLAIPFIFDINPAYAQTVINVTESAEPCFMNYTAGSDLWSNCGFEEDYLAAVLLPWEWVSGGYFSMVGVLVLMTYIKYHTVILPIAIGIVMLPTSYFLFPDVFLSYAIILMFVGIGVLIWFAYIRQTRE